MLKGISDNSDAAYNAPDYLESFKIAKQLRVIDMDQAEAKKLQIALGFCLPSQILLIDAATRKFNQK